MYKFDDFDARINVEEISRDDLDYEGIYDYVREEPDNEAVDRALGNTRRASRYNFLYWD